VQKGFEIFFVKLPALLLISVSAASVCAQDTTTGVPSGGAATPNRIVSLASTFFEHDYFNFYAYGNGVYDSYAPVVQNGQTVNNGGAAGFAVGGGVNAYHSFRDGGISLDYRGDYRDYQSTFFSSGTDQDLALAISKRLSRRWSFTTSASAGIFLYGGTYFPTQAAGISNPITNPNAVIPNPFSNETKFISSGVSMSYRQTRRLSYIFSGNFYLQRYTYPGAIGTTGGTGSARAEYRLTPLTDISGSYAHSYFVYTQNVGNASVDSFGATLSHMFPSHWRVSVSGGVSRTDTSGVVAVPVTLLIPGSTQQAVGGYVLGHFSRVAYIPTFSGTASHYYRHAVLSVSAGEGVTGSGNGYYLASRNFYVNGFLSYNIERRSSFGVGGAYYRLSSVANTVANSYSSASLTASYGTMLVRHLGTFVRYELIHYGYLAPSPAVTDNRISFGFNYSSKSVPMTLY
jgi:hypothetical protein